MFKLVSPWPLSPVQKKASEKLFKGLSQKDHPLALMGVTGSGKTFTLARVIEQWARPALIISHNKTLAAQLYTEFKSFFPHSAVCYFVSYYDYYQPEAYIPSSDTYIDKDASINEQIDKLRLQAVAALSSRQDVIVIATVSCIYGLGSPEDWSEMAFEISANQKISPSAVAKTLSLIQYSRNDIDFSVGSFRLKGGTMDIFSPASANPFRIMWKGESVSRIYEFDPLTYKAVRDMEKLRVFPVKFFVTSKARLKRAISGIKKELNEQLSHFKSGGKLLEAERLRQRTLNDIEMLEETGYCHGIENYSLHLSGRKRGEPPYCLMNYFPRDYLTVIDESHVTLPQLRGMWAGDAARKENLIKFGFRLPTAADNRPLRFGEFEAMTEKVIYSSATPAVCELKKSRNFLVEQLIRPTGLTDPEIFIRTMENAPADLEKELTTLKKNNERALVITLTKRMAEDLSFYFISKGIKTHYLHSDIDTLKRIEILNDLRRGKVDCIVGVNLLREGLDLPEITLVAILDADKEGFLRSRTSLIQISGRAARNISSRVIFYADSVTNSMKSAMDEMARRRAHQVEYNRRHKITPRSIQKIISLDTELIRKSKDGAYGLLKENLDKFTSSSPDLLNQLKKDLREAADNLDFEMAIILRDKILSLGGKIK
ncbi:MAG: excinuclease ABC subunit B [Elusimicrobia bacterium HGW-Elusimicrobia-2]|nr:MAG: excinuclease ABC subunit B [Elusimicrobia bacterium HGW-Elusimicrobia-2]